MTTGTSFDIYKQEPHSTLSGKMTDNNEQLDAILQTLEDPNRFSRRKALMNLKTSIEKSPAAFSNAVFVETILSHAVHEPTESCRQLFLEILTNLFINGFPSPEILKQTINLIVEKLPNETSEELRLRYVKLFTAVLLKATASDIKSFLNTIFEIIIISLKDNYAEILKEACQAICTFGGRFPDSFQLQCESFTIHLIPNLKHRQGNVRVLCIQAIGAMVVHGSDLLIPQLSPHLKNQLSDDNPRIREAAISAAAKAVQRLEFDNPSIESLLPVILIGTCDDFPDVSQKTEQLQTEMLGSAALVERHFTKILTVVRGDAEDWNDNVRLNAAKLLYSLLLNVQQKAESEISEILTLLLFQAEENKEINIIKWVEKSSRLLGEFCPAVSVPGLLNAIKGEEKITVGHFVIFCSMLEAAVKTSAGSSVADDVVQIALLLSSTVQDSWSAKKILDCMQLMANSLDGPNEKTLKNLISILLNCAAVESESETAKIFDVIKELTIKSGASSVPDFFMQNPDLYDPTSEEMSSWTVDSKAWKIFLFLSENLNLEDSQFLTKIFAQLSRVSARPELRLKIFSILSRKMAEIAKSDFWKQFFLSEIVPVLRENLKWKSGNTAMILRAAASVCWSRGLEEGIFPASESGDQARLLMILIEDEDPRTRAAVCSGLAAIFKQSNPLQEEDLIRVLNALVGRLDDVSRQVRISAMKTLTASFSTSRDPSEEERRVLEKFLETAVLLMDDTDHPTAAEAENVLRQLAVKYSDLVYGKLEKSKNINKVGALLKHLKL